MSPQLGPLGRREFVPRLQEHSRRLSGALERVAEGRQRNRGFFGGIVRGVSNACEGSKILSFLFRPRLVCSSLLHLRSSWKVNSQKFVQPWPTARFLGNNTSRKYATSVTLVRYGYYMATWLHAQEWSIYSALHPDKEREAKQV